MNVKHHATRIAASADPESAFADFLSAIGRELREPTVDALTLSSRLTEASPHIAAALSIDRVARQQKLDVAAADAARRGHRPGVSDTPGYDPTTGKVGPGAA